MKATGLYAQKWKILGKFCVMCVLPQKFKERRWDFPGSQWLRLCTSSVVGVDVGAWGAGSIPGQETKIPACLMAQSRKKKKERNRKKLYKNT